MSDFNDVGDEYKKLNTDVKGMPIDTSREEINEAAKKFSQTYGYRIGFLVLAFCLFVVNLTAVAISLNCNRTEPLGYRIASALYAFMFGFIYIFINYLGYKVKMKQEVCRIYTKKPFIFF